jgi:DNA (cytosine-5)-methyltransferase 1
MVRSVGETYPTDDRNRVIDLFCGAGGLTQGFKDAGFQVIYALDKDPDSCATYRLNHPDVDLDERSITDLSPQEIADRVGPIAVVVGGPACQGFSTAGRKNGWVRVDDERNELWSYMLRLVRKLKPRAFLLENVPGLMYWRYGDFGYKILEGFAAAGYRVDFHILLAANYGVPQLRRRLFMVGVRGRQRFAFPEPTHLGSWRRDTQKLWEQERSRRGLLRHVSCWDAMGDLPPLAGGNGASTTIYPHVGELSEYAKVMRENALVLYDHELSPMPPEHQSLIRHVPQGGTWRDIPAYLLPERFFGMRRTDSSNLLGRLDPQRPAYTITTQFDNVTVGCYVHPWEDRALSVREGARLQSFPDQYRFVGSIPSRCRQIGNAVPPMLAGVLAAAIGKHIASSPSLQASWITVPVRPSLSPAPPPTDPTTGLRMRRQKRLDTAPEVLLRKALHARGLRFRVAVKPVAGIRRQIDVAFMTARLAVFVDGCFWHGCPEHARPTKSHTVWWADKIAANRTRDLETTKFLESLGWRVIRVWEHQKPDEAAAMIEEAVRGSSSDPAIPGNLAGTALRAASKGPSIAASAS